MVATANFWLKAKCFSSYKKAWIKFMIWFADEASNTIIFWWTHMPEWPFFSFIGLFCHDTQCPSWKKINKSLYFCSYFPLKAPEWLTNITSLIQTNKEWIITNWNKTVPGVKRRNNLLKGNLVGRLFSSGNGNSS